MTERMLDTSITATSFDPDAEGGSLPDRAQVVIVGGGVIGSSIAYHLAGLGIHPRLDVGHVLVVLDVDVTLVRLGKRLS